VSAALERLLAHGVPDEVEVREFLLGHEFPIVEDDQVTFVWHGEADEVYLRHFVYALPSAQALERVPGTDLWQTTLSLPPGSRVEYKFELVQGKTRGLVLDPLNPRRAHDPYGTNSVCQARGYVEPAWAEPDPQAPTGRVEEAVVRSAAFGNDRRLLVYLPPRMRPRRRYAVLVAHDGADYLRFARLQTVLDNLIHRLEIPQMVVALTQSPNRSSEYAAEEAHATFLVDELLPHLSAHFHASPLAEQRGLLGASLGAVASLHAAWTRPGAFGRLLLESGSFAFTDIGKGRREGPVFERIVRFVNAFRDTPGRPADRMFVSCGVYESLIYENRSLYPLLQSTGAEVRYVEARDGHNWENWRDRLRDGLTWLFPGPLWTTYE
jgi:enterochelin esterase family protein